MEAVSYCAQYHTELIFKKNTQQKYVIHCFVQKAVPHLRTETYKCCQFILHWSITNHRNTIHIFVGWWPIAAQNLIIWVFLSGWCKDAPYYVGLHSMAACVFWLWHCVYECSTQPLGLCTLCLFQSGSYHPHHHASTVHCRAFRDTTNTKTNTLSFPNYLFIILMSQDDMKNTYWLSNVL